MLQLKISRAQVDEQAGVHAWPASTSKSWTRIEALNLGVFSKSPWTAAVSKTSRSAKGFQLFRRRG